jgi:alkanesulfonate monooxygenase SsuD/methylene tetrahydromethanopterin reductase-like flavin-dependent oxidoreductase (luciferase family)
MYLDVVGRLDPTLELGPAQTPPLEKFTLAGTPAEVTRQAAALYDAGVARVEFGDPQGLDLLLDHVVPALRPAG